MRRYLADAAWAWRRGATAPELIEGAAITVDADGRIAAIGTEDDPGLSDGPSHAPLVCDLGRALVVPGLVNGHSHAFQRALRGTTHHGRVDDAESFWSWRDGMYELAGRLDPEGVYELTRRCFAEMLRSGITCVGEFHYLHHQPDGSSYSDPNELSWAIVRAANDVGIRLVLLDVLYQRAGGGPTGPVPPRPEQRRFCDRDVDAYLARVDALRSRAAGEDWSVGLAPHSVRAVGLDQLRALAAYANAAGLPIHAHVSEQLRENDECRAEHGRTPTAVFEHAGCLSRAGAFTAVHAVHVSDADRASLVGHTVCACPSTEADLGDGIVPASAHAAAGVRLSLGSDSNALIDLVREAGALEMNERLRTGRRVCLGTIDPSRPDTRLNAPALIDAMTLGGARSLGRPELGRLAVGCPFDAAVFDTDHVTLVDVPAQQRLTALLTAGSAASCRTTFVAGEQAT